MRENPPPRWGSRGRCRIVTTEASGFDQQSLPAACPEPNDVRSFLARADHFVHQATLDLKTVGAPCPQNIVEIPQGLG